LINYYPRYIFIVGHINLLSNYKYFFLPRIRVRVRVRVGVRVRVRVKVRVRIRTWLFNRSPIVSFKKLTTYYL